MVDFCIEPEKLCDKDPIKELDLKVDQYYSSIYSRLCKHTNDSTVHITQEERNEWNNKASKEALKDIQDQLNEITSDESGSMKYEILLEVSKQITAAIDGLNLGDYAKKKYVDEAIKNINLDGYVTNDDADSTYLKIVDYKKFDADSYYTKAEIQNMLKNSNIGKDYSIESFVTENNKLILTQKNGGQFSVNLSGIGSGVGVDADYVQDQLSNYIKKNTLSKLIINDKVYSIENGSDIKIPTSSASSNIDPTTFGQYKSYFKETTSNQTIPNKPSANKPPQDGSGWIDTTPDYKAGYYIWMTQVFINGNGQYGEYMNPICITGASGKDGSGSAGEDGSGVSFIYKRSIDGEGVTNPGAVTVINGVPEVPVGWNNHPSGVTKEVPYEYCSCVTSDKGKWGTMWREPFIWSHFGQNGMDGDGVEYIYYVALIAPTNNLPESWTNDEGFQNNEYIKYGSGWTDNPQDLDSKEFGPGYKQWVSVRKKYSDNDGQDPYWHAYSSPALWGYYSKDGIASALIMDVTGENKYLYLTQQNQNKGFQSSSIAHMYNDGASIDFTLSIDSFIDSAGNDHSSDKNRYFTIDGNQIDINIPEGSLSFDNDIYYRIILIGKPKLTSISSQIRQAEIQLFGLVRGADGGKGDPGENAVSYDIKTSASAINYQDGSMYPNLINVYVTKSDGSQITNITPSNSSDWHFSYSINDGDTWNTISSDQIQTEGDNGMLFKATNGTITLSEYVPIVKSGIDGLNGVTYSLQLSNISLSYAQADQNYSLQMSFNVNLYKNGSTVNNTEANLYMQLNSNSRTSLQYDSDHWNAAINTTVQPKSSTITIYAYNTNGAYLTSMTIPVSASGQKGDKGDPGDASVGQTFKGSPLRMSREVDGKITTDWKKGFKYYDGKRDAEDGIFYQDVVLYENMYYVCVNTDLGNDSGWNLTPDVAGYWQKFAVTENFVADKIVANQAYIKELSSKEVVIMDDDRIVAGMTSSKALEHSSLNDVTKGNVRIWAGEISNADLTTAPFFVTNKGDVVANSVSTNSEVGWRISDKVWISDKNIDYIEPSGTKTANVNKSGDWLDNEFNGNSAQRKDLVDINIGNIEYFGDSNNIRIYIPKDIYLNTNSTGHQVNGQIITLSFCNYRLVVRSDEGRKVLWEATTKSATIPAKPEGYSVRATGYVHIIIETQVGIPTTLSTGSITKIFETTYRSSGDMTINYESRPYVLSVCPNKFAVNIGNNTAYVTTDGIKFISGKYALKINQDGINVTSNYTNTNPIWKSLTD